MACPKREKTGSCSHHQCGFPALTGLNCVDITTHNGVSFCELGVGCVKECPYSWKDGDGSAVEKAANEWYSKYTEYLKEQEKELF